MKGTLEFDPELYDYGPATIAVRQILRELATIDWFEPSETSDDECIRLFTAHSALAHIRAPELFPDHVELKVISGGWPEFSAWCKRVRKPRSAWDWKFGALKELSRAHQLACNWTIAAEAEARRLPKGRPPEGALFFRLGELPSEGIVWNALCKEPDLTLLDEGPREAASFYFGFARNDVFHCIEWQLAERGIDLALNPFPPLLRCYNAGCYPFVLGRDTAVLFRFVAAKSTLPKARVQKRASH